MNDNGYGHGFLVGFNSAPFILLAASFFHPKSKRDWRVMGGFSLFVIAVFTEMYGYPPAYLVLRRAVGRGGVGTDFTDAIP